MLKCLTLKISKPIQYCIHIISQQINTIFLTRQRTFETFNYVNSSMHYMPLLFTLFKVTFNNNLYLLDAGRRILLRGRVQNLLGPKKEHLNKLFIINTLLLRCTDVAIAFIGGPLQTVKILLFD
jgi:hypothetical protein